MAARGGSVAAASIAAHQVGIQLWLLCSFFCDSLAAASQGLVADALGRDDAKDVLEVANTVFLYSLILGLFLAALLQVGLSSGLLFELFSKDTDVRACLSEILPFIIIAQPLNALVFSADGVLQGASQFPYQAKAMLISGLTAVSTFAAMEYFQVGSERLVHVWSALIALQVMRGLTSLWKLIDEEGPINLLRK
jgi:Na+-driven multidrug efflux pump